MHGVLRWLSCFTLIIQSSLTAGTLPDLLAVEGRQYPLPDDLRRDLGAVLEGDGSDNGVDGTVEDDLLSGAGKVLGLDT